MRPTRSASCAPAAAHSASNAAAATGLVTHPSRRHRHGVQPQTPVHCYTASLLLAQCLEISEILRPATRAFVLPKGRTTENRNVHSRHIAFHAILPGSVERYAADRCKDVDPIRRKSQLSDDIRPYEVVERDAKVNERSTKGRERCQDARRVPRVRLYQDIEVAGRAGDAVHGKRVRAHDQKNHLMGDKLTKHVAKIVDHGPPCAPCSRSVDNFTGISFRE